MGPIKTTINESGYSFNGGPITMTVNVADLLEAELGMGFDVKFPGFADGFNKAAELYFKYAREAASSGR